MAKGFTVSLEDMIKETGLETVYMPAKPSEILVSSSDVNRPGLPLGGYFDYFDSDRVQVLGKSEAGYLEDLDAEVRAARVDDFVSRRPPAVIISACSPHYPPRRFCRSIRRRYPPDRGQRRRQERNGD